MLNISASRLRSRAKKEVKEYLVHLLEDRGIEVGTYRNYVAGLKFLHRTTLEWEDIVDDIRYSYPDCSKIVTVPLPSANSGFSSKKSPWLRRPFHTGQLLLKILGQVEDRNACRRALEYVL